MNQQATLAKQAASSSASTKNQETGNNNAATRFPEGNHCFIKREARSLFGSSGGESEDNKNYQMVERHYPEINIPN